MPRLALLLACVAAAFALFYVSARTPEPLPVNAPANQFSAGRAIADIAHLAPVPHPIGTDANHRTRDYVIARMTALGLNPRVQRTQAFNARAFRGGTYVGGGTVENVIGLLPGRNHDLPALALMAHYDSVPNSPGAADDSAGVSTALETARLIKLKGTPARDVMVVITDGEEPGLLGAQGFYGQDPAAAHVGFILNMETRGGGGRTQMFQTGHDNGDAIALFQKAAVGPSTSSLTVYIYKMLPNDTDFTVSDKKGIPGFNFAFIGRQFDYHSPTSTVANLDAGSIQSMGDQVAPTALAIAFSEQLPARAPDAVYSDVLGAFIIAYPAWGGWVLLAISAALAGYGGWRARRAKALSWRDLWQGVGAGVLLLVGGALVLHLTRLATGVGFGWIEGRALLARFPVFEIAMAASALALALFVPVAMARGKQRILGEVVFALVGFLVAFLGNFETVPLIEGFSGGALCMVLVALVFSRPATVAGAWTGLIFTGLGVELALQIAAPTAAMVVSWPVAAASLMAAISAAGARRGLVVTVVNVVITVVSLAWVGGFLHGLMQAMDMPQLPAMSLWAGAMLIWPLAWPSDPQSRTAYAPAAGFYAVSIAVALFLAFTSPWSARYPQSASPLYVVDHDSGKAWRAETSAPGDWSRAALTADGGTITRQRFPTFPRPAWAAAAKPVAAAAPAFTVEHAADGTVTLRLQMPPDAQAVEFSLKTNTVVTAATVNGERAPLFAKPGDPTYVSWNRSAEPLVITLKTVGPGALDIEYAAVLDHWPADAKPPPPMPATVMGFGEAGSTVVVGRQKATW